MTPQETEATREMDDVGVGDLISVYIASYTSLVRLAMFLLGDVGAAEDAVQDVFVQLAAKAPHLDDDSKARAYLNRMVVNGCRTMQRRSTIALRLPWRQDSAASVSSAEESAMTAFHRDDLVVALRKLPRRKREVVVLRHYCDLSEKQVAELLGVSVGSVKALSSRGLADLAALMGERQ